MDRCPGCGADVSDLPNDICSSYCEAQLAVAACEQAGHMLQGDTCYCGMNVHPSCR